MGNVTEEGAAKKRLITRSDFDGLVCAMLLKELGLIGEIKFVHPKDVQDGKVDITSNDITTNLPFDDRVGLAFDHHESELLRVDAEKAKGRFIIDGDAKSAARVVYDYYGGAKVFTRVSEEIMWAVDKGDSADFTKEEILDPKGWVLLNFLMDARTGLGRFHDFRISNYQLMMELIDFCVDHSIDEVLALPDVKERVDLYFEQQELFKKQLAEIAEVHDKVVVIDLREQETIYGGQPLHDLRDVSGDRDLCPCRVGLQEAEHGGHDRQVDHQQSLAGQHRRPLPLLRRRRTRQRGHLPA